MSLARGIEPFLYSRRNIAGTLLALGGLALYFMGITSGLIGLAVVAGLYGIGYLLTKPERGLALSLGGAQDAGEIRAGLERLLASIRGRVADDIYQRVESIRDSILVTLPREAGGGAVDAADPNVHLIRQTALTYLPQALDSYLAVPRIYAERRPVANGRTPHDVMLEQLDLMDRKMQEVAGDVVTHDSERLLANGRFLAERFATSSLTLTPESVAAESADSDRRRIV